MNQKRQPKGTENGGQFAPDVNPESTLELGDESTMLDGASATGLELAERINNVHDMLQGFDVDNDQLSKEDFAYMYAALEDAREVFGAGGPHSSDAPPLTADERKGEVDAIKIGTKVGGIEIGEWVDFDGRDPAIVMQVTTVNEASQLDAEGWWPRGVAQILKERKIKVAKISDVLDIFDESEVVSIAFDPRRGTHQILMEINAALKEMKS
jgi:hypothetical protein